MHMAKLKINMAGDVFDVTKYELVTELLMQRRFDAWLGKDTVKVKLNKLSDNEVEVTIFRKYGTFYEPENHRTIEQNGQITKIYFLLIVSFFLVLIIK